MFCLCSLRVLLFQIHPYLCGSVSICGFDHFQDLRSSASIGGSRLLRSRAKPAFCHAVYLYPLVSGYRTRSGTCYDFSEDSPTLERSKVGDTSVYGWRILLGRLKPASEGKPAECSTDLVLSDRDYETARQFVEAEIERLGPWKPTPRLFRDPTITSRPASQPTSDE